MTQIISCSPRRVLAIMKKSRLRAASIAVLALLVAWWLFLWQGAPLLLASWLVRWVAENTGYRLTLPRLAFDPFALRVRVGALELATPTGERLFSGQAAVIDLSWQSLWRRALVIDAVELLQPVVTFVDDPQEKNHFAGLLAAWRTRQAADDQAALPLSIARLQIHAGRIEYTARAQHMRAETVSVFPLDFSLTDFSTDGEGRFELVAKGSWGGEFKAAGRLSVSPLRLSAQVELAGASLAALNPWLPFSPISDVSGELSARLRVALSRAEDAFDVLVDDLALSLSQARLHATLPNRVPIAAEIERLTLSQGVYRSHEQRVAAESLALEGVKLGVSGEEAASLAALVITRPHLALATREIEIEALTLAGFSGRLTRRADGRIDGLVRLVPLTGNEAQLAFPSDGEESPRWRYRVGQTIAVDGRVHWRDETVTPVAEATVGWSRLALGTLTDELAEPVAISAELGVEAGGALRLAGHITPKPLAGELAFRLAGLSLRPFQPYLATFTTLRIVDGRLSGEGRLRYDEGKALRVTADARLDALHLLAPGWDRPFLAWERLSVHGLSLERQALTVREAIVTGLDAELVIDAEKRVNLSQVLKREKITAPGAAAAEPAASSWTFMLERLRCEHCALDFADLSLLMPFFARIYELSGVIVNLANTLDASGHLEFEGRVDEGGLVRAAGRVDLFDPTRVLDLDARFRNIEMTRLTPYAATFLGRKITSGKLSLALRYTVENRQLTGDNRVIIDRLVLGEHVASPQARDLPLDLALALLQDAEGRIELGLPISGSLDDPQVSVGALVWKAISNVIGKIVSAPLRLLAALSGGGEKDESIAFAPGSAKLLPPEREKIARLAQALAKRPSLLLGIEGAYAEADRWALADAAVRRAVLLQAGYTVPEREDPGPISITHPKIQAALEALYAERFGADDLSKLKEAFRAANPGQLPATLGERLFSRMAGMLRENMTVSAEEIERLKGAHYPMELYARLVEREAITETDLMALAKARAAEVWRGFREEGVAPERLRQAAPGVSERREADMIPLRLFLETEK
ncbi:MAG: DUF748 domain-containing protein [Rhodocyclaceae bacterium]|nr:DUF748 domain-containing protein [Rhodocyclaceae bacterium]